MISRHFPVRAPRLRVLAGIRRSWLSRFWDTEELFELKLTLLVAMTLVGAWVGA